MRYQEQGKKTAVRIDHEELALFMDNHESSYEAFLLTMDAMKIADSFAAMTTLGLSLYNKVLHEYRGVCGTCKPVIGSKDNFAGEMIRRFKNGEF